MAWVPPSIGSLRSSVRFERRVDSADGIGGFTSSWSPVATVAAKLTPLKGGEEVRAARLSGQEPVEITVRSETLTRSITSADRAVDVRSGQTFNIKWTGNLDERDRFITVIAQAGGHADG